MQNNKAISTMKKKAIIIFYFILGLFLFIKAQEHPHGNYGREMPADGVLSGKIVDAEVNQAVSYANAILYKTKDSSIVNGTIADKNGYFIIEKLPYGRFYLIINFIGYEKKKITGIVLHPKQKEVDIGTIELNKAVTMIEEVEVIADKYPVEYKIDKKIINVNHDIVAAGGTAVDILENIPSVQTDIDGNVSLRGSSNFTVLIDGKPSIFEGSEALLQIPASSIESIEIITNPSAKYDPDGIAGIINVIMKKQKDKGFNGLINANVASNNVYGGGILFNNKKGKTNFFIDASYNMRNRPGFSKTERETWLNDTTYFMITDGDRNMRHGRNKIKAGIDYSFNPKKSLTVSGEIGNRLFGFDNSTNYYQYSSPASYDEYYIIDKLFDVKSTYYGGDIYYLNKFKQKGHELSASAYYRNNTGKDTDKLDEFTTNNNWEPISSVPERQRSLENNTTVKMRINTDYTKPVGGNGKLEAGYQAQYYSGEAEFSIENYDTDINGWVSNDSLYNSTDYYRNIQSIYGTFANKLSGFEFLLGLRGEYTDRVIKQNILDTSYIVNSFDYFPTLHISRPIGKTHQVQASYSRRIRRPRSWYLDPFPNYSDPLNIRIGNPELEPEYTDSYELNYQKKFKTSFVALEAYYRETNNKINRVKTLRDDNVMIHTFANLDRDYSLGIELMTYLELKKWLQINASSNFYKYHIDGEIMETEVNQAINTWSMRLNTTFKLKWATRLQLMVYYSGPSVTAQGSRSEFFMTSFAVRQDFMKRKLSFTFSIRDIFSTMRYSHTSEGENFYSFSEFTRKSPVFSINLSYRVNNYKKIRRDSEQEMDFGGEGEM